ncbi:MAG: hypothetical protein ACYC44_03430, partial [Patescibacteria group bacterium]
KAGLDELHPDEMALNTIRSLEKKLNKLNEEVVSQPELEEKAPKSGEKKTEAVENRLSPEQIKTRTLELVEKAEGLLLSPEELALENPEEMLIRKKAKFHDIIADIINEPEEFGLSEEVSELEDALNNYFNLLVRLGNKTIGVAGKKGVMRAEKIKPDDYAYHSKELRQVLDNLKGMPSAEVQLKAGKPVAPETLGKEDVIPEIKTSPMAETIKQPAAEEANRETKAYIDMVTEAALAEPEAVPVKKTKTARAKPEAVTIVAPVDVPKAKVPETLKKPPEPVKSKVETRRAPAEIVFEGKTEDLLKGAARSGAEQKKSRLEARLSEIKNSETNEWSDAYFELGGFNQELWEQLSAEKGNEAKSEKERFKELRLNAVDYDLKETEIGNALRIKRNRIAGYEQKLKDGSLNRGDREDLEDELKDIINSEKAALLELKGIEDLRKKDEAEEMELLGKAKERLAAKKAEAKIGTGTEGDIDVDLSEINSAITPEAQAAGTGESKKTGKFKSFAKKTGMVAGYGLGIGAAYVIRPAAKGLIAAAQWIGWKGQLKLFEGLMNFSKDPGAWFTEKFKKTEGFDFGKWLNERNKKKTEKTSKE